MNLESFVQRFQKIPVVEYHNTVPNSPLVSVCVQTYQHVDLIRQCLDGILMQQTSFPIEVLLGEDASADGTRDVCIEYADKFPSKIRLFMHHRKNNILILENPTGRFNLVYNLFAAEGKYIALCEGDDYWVDPLKLQKQIEFLEESLDFSLCGHWSNKLEQDKLTGRTLGKFKKSEFNFNDIAGSNVRIPTSSIVFRNQLVFPDWFCQVYGGDMALIFLNAEKGRIKILDFIGSVYRIHAGGVEQQIKKNKKTIALRNIKEYILYWHLLSGLSKKKMARKIAWNYFYLSLIYMKEWSIMNGIIAMFSAFLFKIRQYYLNF